MSDYTTPISNYKPPKESKTIEWLANWLNHRRAQLYNNLGGMFHFTSRDTYNIPQKEWARANSPNRRTYVNKNFYSQIENAASAKLYNHTLSDWDGGLALGYYSPSKHEVHVRPPVFEEENYGNPEVHEYVHAMKANPQIYAIGEIEKTAKARDGWSSDDAGYLLNPGEIYSRMMEFRYVTKMKPEQIVDQKFLNSHRDSIKQFKLDMFEDKDLIKLFNEVAQNDFSEILLMAKQGSVIQRFKKRRHF